LQNNNKRYADHKAFVQGFVPYKPHCKVHSHAASQKCQCPKRSFTHTPLAAFCAAFIGCTYNNGNKIYYNKPYGKYFFILFQEASPCIFYQPYTAFSSCFLSLHIIRFSSLDIYDWEIPSASATSFWVYSSYPFIPNRISIICFSAAARTQSLKAKIFRPPARFPCLPRRRRCLKHRIKAARFRPNQY